MRITNQMMVNSSLANIQVNKGQMSTLDTQLSTQKKINKPSEDPIIAIRALRLRSSLDQVTQYLGKNIPDASSWMSVTHDALDESYDIVSDLYKYCVQGSTDSYSAAERNTIGESLKKLVNAYYSQGDVDYAGRHVFTGFNTDKTLTYQSDEAAADVDYTITQSFTRDDLSTKKVYTNAYSNKDIINLDVKKDANGEIITPNVADVHRLQLAYKDVNAESFNINGTDITLADDAATASVDVNGVTAAVSKTTDANAIPGDNDIIINSTTGEVLLGKNVYQKIYTDNEFTFTYNKDNFIKGDIDPAMYYNCVDNNTGIVYNKEKEDIEYNVNFSQKLKVNTEAEEAFNMYLGRNVDDLVTAVQNRIDVENQITQVEGMMKEEAYSDGASQKKLSSILEGLNKQNDLAKKQMTVAFEKGITQMKGYQQQISNAKADVGNRQTRLELTKSRLTEQKTNFTSLKSENEDIDLEEVVINYSSAELVYNASLTAASKVVRQSLLDFL
ncbi:MAG: flagellin [Eubacteriales bacterium]|nr:flagellin [Eubacteriales bacterium]